MKKIRLLFCLFLFALVCGCEKPAAIGEDLEKLLVIEDKDNIQSFGNFVYYFNQEQDKDVEFYGYMKGDELIELEPKTASGEVTFQGVTGSFEITYCTYEGKSWITDQANLPVTVGDDEFVFFVREIEGDIIEMELARNAQQDEWSYPFYYNLQTGEITDYLKDITISGLPLAQQPQLSIERSFPEKELLYISVNKEIFAIDLKTGKSISLNELTGEPDIRLFQILEDGYFLVVPDEKGNEERKGVYFKTASGKKEILFDGAKQAATVYDDSDIYTFIVLIDNDAVLLKEKGILYCIDHRTGEKWKVGAWEGLRHGAWSRIGEKVILEGEQNVGILDLEKKIYQEIEIKKDDLYRMCYLCDDNSMTVLFHEHGAEYLTKYKLE